MQTTCPPGPKNCSLAYCHSELHGRGSRLGIRGHRSYHTTDTPQLLEIRNFQLRAAPPDPGSRYTRIPADVMQGALPIILNLLSQHSQESLLIWLLLLVLLLSWLLLLVLLLIRLLLLLLLLLILLVLALLLLFLLPGLPPLLLLLLSFD